MAIIPFTTLFLSLSLWGLSSINVKLHGGESQKVSTKPQKHMHRRLRQHNWKETQQQQQQQQQLYDVNLSNSEAAVVTAAEMEAGETTPQGNKNQATTLLTSIEHHHYQRHLEDAPENNGEDDDDNDDYLDARTWNRYNYYTHKANTKKTNAYKSTNTATTKKTNGYKNTATTKKTNAYRANQNDDGNNEGDDGSAATDDGNDNYFKYPDSAMWKKYFGDDDASYNFGTVKEEAKEDYVNMFQTAPRYWNPIDWVLFSGTLTAFAIMCSCCFCRKPAIMTCWDKYCDSCCH